MSARRPRSWLRRTQAGAAVLALGLIHLGILPERAAQAARDRAAAATPTGAPVGGTVYRDHDADGTRAATEPGQGGVDVAVTCVSDTGPDGTVGTEDDVQAPPVTTTSAADGSWSVTAPGSPCRVQFSLPSSLPYLRPGAAGGSFVQFTDAPGTVDVGVNDPADYCQDNPTLAVACFHFGPVTGANAATTAISSFANDVSTDSQFPGPLATVGDLGAVWGLAADRATGEYYAATFIKRNVGIKASPGTIFVVPKAGSGGSVAPLVTLPAGTDPHPADGAGTDAWLRDAGTWDAVGKVGLGDLDVSADGTTLYAVNLFDRKLYSIPVADPTAWTAAAIPVPSDCATDDWRPFGIGLDGDRIYVGGVCTNQSLQAETSAFAATVWSTTASMASFTQVLRFPLTKAAYPRKCADPGSSANTSINDNGNDASGTCAASTNAKLNAGWQPWLPSTPPADYAAQGTSTPRYHEPWLTDISVDGQGNLALGLRSRFGDQQGWRTYAPGGTSTTLYNGIGMGDLLKACRPAGATTFTIEANGACGGLTGGGVANKEGPGGGEFFNADDNYYHDQTGVGGTVALKTNPEVVTSVFDPRAGQGQVNEGGVTWQDPANGARQRATRIYTTTAGNDVFGKANGLGGLEALCDLAPVEVGNRLWVDADRDGQQDPGEAPLAGVTVQLQRGGTTIGATTTAADGTYVFGGVTDRNLDSGEHLVTGTDYAVRVPNAEGDSQQGALHHLALTDGDQGADATDSDGSLVGSAATAAVRTGAAGANDHTIDFGFVPLAFDLALRKQLAPAQPASIRPDDDVTFRITVVNQGEIPATDVEVTDHLPPELELADSDWTDDGDGTARRTIAGPLAPGASTYVDVTFHVPDDVPLHRIDNLAEISRARDEAGAATTDVDSTPDTDGTNDPLVDDVIDGTGGDEDDHDVASVTPQAIPFDLALRKELAPGQDDVVRQGGDVTFRLTVVNQGEQRATNVTLTDHIPAGLELHDDDWAEGGSTASITLPGPLAPGASTTVDITFTVAGNAPAGRIVNTAEISSATDRNGHPVVDLDSTPDAIAGNDALIDDEVDESPATGDEDDSDVADVTVPSFDLALRKTVGQTFVKQGQLVPFTITVFNQGEIPAAGIVVTDTLPTDLSFSAADNPGWTAGGDGTATTTINGPLAPGASTAVTLQLRVDGIAASGSYTNTAEISAATDEDGVIRTDADSTPDADPSNDTLVDDAIDGSGGDEDDADVATVKVFDLALKKTTTAGRVQVGDDVPFTISVTNQGTEDATDVQVTDHVPDELRFDAHDNPGWTDAGDGTVTADLPGTLAAGTTRDLTIVLHVEQRADRIDNLAEISRAQDHLGHDVPDIDSTPDQDPDNDTLVDNVTDNTGGDEDDHDIASVGSPVFDLALRKTTSSRTVWPGDDVTFTIRVFNQGQQAAHDIDVVDYPTNDLRFVAADNPGWTQDGDGYLHTRIDGPLAPGADTAVTVHLQVPEGAPADTAITNTAEIESALDVDGRPGQDVDSVADTDPDDDVLKDEAIDGEDGDEDDADVAEVVTPLFDLALKKTLAEGQPSAVYVGDDVRYTITVVNQGNATATDITVDDHLPAGTTFDPARNQGWTEVHDGEVQRTIAGPLAAGDAIDVPLVLTLASRDGAVARNVAEISAAGDEDGTPRRDVDSTPDTDPDDDTVVDDEVENAGGDQDDQDVADVRTPVFDLALEKGLAEGQPSSVYPGGSATFDITVFNQGEVTAADVEVVDHLPSGLGFVAEQAPDWTLHDDRTITTVVPGPLAPGGHVTIQVTLPVVAPGPIDNLAEIALAHDDEGRTPPDVDSVADLDPDNDVLVDDVTDGTGGDEDDHDIASLDSPRFDLALRKELDDAEQRYAVGDTVPFRITVFNQGDVAARDVSVVDHVPDGMAFASDANPAWTKQGDDVTTTIDGPIGPGDRASVVLRLEVARNATGELVNGAEITRAEDPDGRTPADVDSTPDDDPTNDQVVDDVIDGSDGDEDDSDIATVTTTAIQDEDEPTTTTPTTTAPTTAPQGSSGEGLDRTPPAADPVETGHAGPLAYTGADLGWLALSGFCLIGLGLALSRRPVRRPRPLRFTPLT